MMRRRFSISSIKLITHHLNSSSSHNITLTKSILPPQVHPHLTNLFKSPRFTFPISSLSSLITNPQSTSDLDDEDDIHCSSFPSGSESEDTRIITGILMANRSNCCLLKEKLDKCGIRATSELVVQVLSRVRNDWEAAFTFFIWAGNQSGYVHSLREYHSMISILGKMRKFDTAWNLINEMKDLVTPQTLIIMIRRYCAVHDVGKAINTFYAFKKYKFEMGMGEFQSLLSALCRYKNVKDAESMLFCNEDVFPLNTKSFNIILNGWCNVAANLREGKRIWREMSERRIPRDAVSFACLISCCSKSKKLKEVLKLFNQMKLLNISPDRKVYNGVIHALAKGQLIKEARNLMKTMEERGIHPNTITYNSYLMPLCKARQLNEAQEAFNEMLERGLIPTVRTYHAFFRILRTGEDVFELLKKMRAMGCKPSHETYIMLIRKFCRWRQLDDVIKIWDSMIEHGLDPDRSCYTAIIHGLFLNGMLDKSYKYYLAMKAKDMLPEPNIEDIIQKWLAGKNGGEVKENYGDGKRKVEVKDFELERDLKMKPEARRVVRERGFSFWEK